LYESGLGLGSRIEEVLNEVEVCVEECEGCTNVSKMEMEDCWEVKDGYFKDSYHVLPCLLRASYDA